jgi:hypothetical protein
MTDTQQSFLSPDGSEIRIYTKVPSYSATREVRRLAANFKPNPNVKAQEEKQRAILDRLAEQGFVISGISDSQQQTLQAVREGKLKMSELLEMNLIEDAPIEIQEHNDTVYFDIFCAILDTTKNSEAARVQLANREWLQDQDFSAITAIVDDFFARAGMKKPA